MNGPVELYQVNRWQLKLYLRPFTGHSPGIKEMKIRT